MSRITQRRPLVVTAAVLAAAVAVVVVLLTSSSSSTPRRPAAAPSAAVSTTIAARHTRLGTILVSSGGETLYAFSRDRRGHDACAGIRGCLTAWPLVAARGHVTAGRGVRASLLSTIVVAGQRQVTYAGHPLYNWVDNGAPGDVSYVGARSSGGTWPAVTAAGRLVG